VTPAHAPSRVVGVKRLADYLKRKLDGDQQLRAVSVRGEVSNLSVSPRGSMNFDLKEGDVILRCFAWPDDGANFPAFKNGVAIVATGGISTYAQKSSYQLIVRVVEREGVGDVHALFEERKKRLAAEGLFDPARKRPLPAFPFRVALVSSRGANGAIDFVQLLADRAPHVAIEWCETTVQGPNAPAEIVAALGRASRADVDLIVVTRGGGSFEDLFAFSDESVVRAIAKARHPTISAIGHTADQQLSDFAADVHVETPSAAAKTVGSDTRDLRGRLDDRTYRAERAVELSIERLQNRLRGALMRSKLTDPRVFLGPLAQRLDDLDTDLADATSSALRRREAARGIVKLGRRRRDDAERRLAVAARASLERAGQRLALTRAHLDGNNPEAILQRGYAIVTLPGGGAIVRDALDVVHGATVEVRLARGTLSARVESRRTDESERKETDGNERIG
jgi:exodeoxyribonuclease VII large subunit